MLFTLNLYLWEVIRPVLRGDGEFTQAFYQLFNVVVEKQVYSIGILYKDLCNIIPLAYAAFFSNTAIL